MSIKSLGPIHRMKTHEERQLWTIKFSVNLNKNFFKLIVMRKEQNYKILLLKTNMKDKVHWFSQFFSFSILKLQTTKLNHRFHWICNHPFWTIILKTTLCLHPTMHNSCNHLYSHTLSTYAEALNVWYGPQSIIIECASISILSHVYVII